MISDYWMFVFGLIGAFGSAATAGALFFVGWQAILTQHQVRLTREQVGRAWIGGTTPPRIAIQFNQVELYCRNYGQLPVKILRTRSGANLQRRLTESDIRAMASNISDTTIIFPNNEHPFSTNTPRLPDAAFQEMTVWFGFIVEYAYHSNDIGEYGYIGQIHQWQTGAIEPIKMDEWFEQRITGKPLNRSRRIWRRMPIP